MATTNYVWNPVTDSYLMETDENHETTATYTVEPTRYGRVVSQYTGGTTETLHFDALGSTREITDENESVVGSNTYDAWGTTHSTTGAASTPFTWIGERGYYSGHGGRVYVRRRSYEPAVARWVSFDVISRLLLTGNPFAYVGNSPVQLVDASGLLSPTEAIGFLRRLLDKTAGQRERQGNCGDHIMHHMWLAAKKGGFGKAFAESAAKALELVPGGKVATATLKQVLGAVLKNVDPKEWADPKAWENAVKDLLTDTLADNPLGKQFLTEALKSLTLFAKTDCVVIEVEREIDCTKKPAWGISCTMLLCLEDDKTKPRSFQKFSHKYRLNGTCVWECCNPTAIEDCGCAGKSVAFRLEGAEVRNWWQTKGEINTKARNVRVK